MLSARIKYIDIARGLAIACVIAVHTGFLPLQHQVLPLITPWMLPVFAVIHGVLAGMRKQDYSWQEIIVKRFRSLLVPYILYGLGSYILWLGLRWYAPDSVLFVSWQTGLHQLLTGAGLVFNGPLWFLPSFFLASLMFAVIRRLVLPINKLGLLFVAHVFVVMAFALNPGRMQLMLSYDLAFLFAACMFMGSWFAATRWEKMNTTAWLILAAVFAALSLYNGTIDVFGRVFHYPVIYWITAVSGSLLAIRASVFIARHSGLLRDALLYSGKYSLILLATHWPIMQWLTLGLSLIGVVGALKGIPTYTSFSYYLPSAVVFTLIEVPLFIIYFLVPYAALWVHFRIFRTH